MLNKKSLTLFSSVFMATPFLYGQQQRPNIIYIMSDDHAAAAVSAYGSRLSEVLPTPNIDRLYHEGIRFDNCYATNSISTPSRACILTGQYSHINQVYTLSDKLDKTRPTLATILQQNGYSTAVIGKWHLVTEPQGFDYYSCFVGQGTYFNPRFIEKDRTDSLGFEESKGKVYNGYCTDLVTNKTIEWISNRTDKSKPFFIMCHFKATHRPWQPAERFKHILDSVVIPEPGNLLDTYETRGKYTDTLEMSLENMVESDLKTPIPSDLPRDAHRKWAYQLYMKDYLGCVAGIDDNVGKLLSYLKESGLDSNTIVIYTSDQGFFLGEHGWFDKRLMQEESIRMPLLIRYPKEIKPESQNSSFLLNIDFAPTLLDYAGIKVPDWMQGESFRKIAAGKENLRWRNAIYYRYWMHNDFWHRSVANLGIRTDKYKLIFYYGAPLGKKGAREPSLVPEWELYDLKNDPTEMNNLYNNPLYKVEIQKLKKELLKLRKKYNDNDPESPDMKRIMNEYFWK